MSAETQKPLVLICDDEIGPRESLNLILSNDYQTEFAENGPEALDKVKTLKPSIIFLDIKMPKLSGLDALKEIKRLLPSVPVVVVSGYQSTEVAKEALKLGASDYIPKPFDSKSVQSALKRCLKN